MADNVWGADTDYGNVVKNAYIANGNYNPDQEGMDWWTNQLKSGAYANQNDFNTAFGAAFKGADTAGKYSSTNGGLTQAQMDEITKAGQTGTNGGVWQDPNTGIFYRANMQNTNQRGESDYTGDQTLAGYIAANYKGGDANDWTANSKYSAYDPTGKQTVDWTAAEDPNEQSWVDYLPYIIGAMGAYGMATYGLAGAAGTAGEGVAGAASNAAYVPWEAGFEGTGALTGAEAGSGIGSFGVVDSSIGLNGATDYSLAGGMGGAQGLQASINPSLSSLATTTGAPGIQAGLGESLSLAAPAGGSLGGGLGLNAATAGNAVLSEAGLTGGLANGTGTLLGPAALQGTTTLADGTILPPTGTTTTPTPTPGGTTKPPVPPIPGGDKGGKNILDGIGLGDLVNLLGGYMDNKNQGEASDKMLAWLKERQGINDNMYKPGSDEYNTLWDEMSRKDAAAGRMSQYGPRSVDLAARIAQLKMDANTRMTTGIGNFMANSLNRKASAPSGLISSLNGLAKNSGLSLGSLIDMVSRGFSGGGGGDTTSIDTSGATPSNEQGYDTTDPNYVTYEGNGLDDSGYMTNGEYYDGYTYGHNTSIN